jgi:hypothetical protein
MLVTYEEAETGRRRQQVPADLTEPEVVQWGWRAMMRMHRPYYVRTYTKQAQLESMPGHAGGLVWRHEIDLTPRIARPRTFTRVARAEAECVRMAGARRAMHVGFVLLL